MVKQRRHTRKYKRHKTVVNPLNVKGFESLDVDASSFKPNGKTIHRVTIQEFKKGKSKTFSKDLKDKKVAYKYASSVFKRRGKL